MVSSCPFNQNNLNELIKMKGIFYAFHNLSDFESNWYKNGLLKIYNMESNICLILYLQRN